MRIKADNVEKLFERLNLQEPSETDKRAVRDDPHLKGEFVISQDSQHPSSASRAVKSKSCAEVHLERILKQEVKCSSFRYRRCRRLISANLRTAPSRIEAALRFVSFGYLFAQSAYRTLILP
ncbi:MAG: hypothetical protein ACE5IY_17465 [bacterium]